MVATVVSVASAVETAASQIMEPAVDGAGSVTAPVVLETYAPGIEHNTTDIVYFKQFKELLYNILKVICMFKGVVQQTK